MHITVSIPTPLVEHDGRRPERCDRCGSQGFNLHQRATKSLKHPLLPRAAVVRFICKRCRKTTRLYPAGVDAARQTVALRQVSVLLYWLGLSYDGIREVLVTSTARSRRRRSGRTSGRAGCSVTDTGCGPTPARWSSRRSRGARRRGSRCAVGRLSSESRAATVTSC
jgi:hypothetical protein